MGLVILNLIGPRILSYYYIFYQFTTSHSHFGLKLRLARIFNTYGPKMLPDDGRVVSNFIVQALADEPLTVYGDGTQTRSFCFVDDLIDLRARWKLAGQIVLSVLAIGLGFEINTIFSIF